MGAAALVFRKTTVWFGPDRPPHLVGENRAIFSHAWNKTSGRQVSPTADDSVSAAKREPEAPERTGVAATDR
jgi:hypothetical protein